MGKTIGFIGSGNMGSAIIRGLIQAGVVNKEDIIVSSGKSGRKEKLQQEIGFQLKENNVIVAQESDILFLAVKPHIIPTVLTELKQTMTNETLIVTVAVGLTIQSYKDALGQEAKVIRALPNTPSAVGEGMTSISFESPVTEEDWHAVNKLFSAIGKTEVIDEKLMNAAAAIAGSSPAFVDMFIESLADGGVLNGLPRASAYKLAAQAVLGSAKLVLESGEHPGLLKDQVCSPSGTTIEAVRTLEKHGFRHAVIDAVDACVKKANHVG
ncbi:pyrroline-5-carboxylate reductase [Terrilactibacillus laevilacticus]|uniref:Pyrroline-5-carboxylate reductase n=1 Tax=Terrilactibacillus laevilacticus TaxID=1380157 RepID=A0ABW5PQT0_9BACI|nr:pyrroline-5-carboxylate reductase [Terrilactibacillus laevilacticus]